MSELKTYDTVMTPSEEGLWVLKSEADMEIRRLKRALYKALSNWARSERYTEATWHGDEHREELWAEVQERCQAMVDKFKEAGK